MHFLRTIDILRNAKYIQFPRVANAFLDTPPIMDDRYSKFYPPLLLHRRVKWRMIYRLSYRVPPFIRVRGREHRFQDTIRSKNWKEFRPERKGDTCFPFLLFTALRLLIIRETMGDRQHLGRSVLVINLITAD